MEAGILCHGKQYEYCDIQFLIGVGFFNFWRSLVSDFQVHGKFSSCFFLFVVSV